MSRIRRCVNIWQLKLIDKDEVKTKNISPLHPLTKPPYVPQRRCASLLDGEDDELSQYIDTFMMCSSTEAIGTYRSPTTTGNHAVAYV